MNYFNESLRRYLKGWLRKLCSIMGNVVNIKFFLNIRSIYYTYLCVRTK